MQPTSFTHLKSILLARTALLFTNTDGTILDYHARIIDAREILALCAMMSLHRKKHAHNL